MRWLRKRKDTRFVLDDLIDRTDGHTDELIALRARVAELAQLGNTAAELFTAYHADIAALQKASHDHCVTCGAMTPRYGMTECGRIDCAQTLVDKLTGTADPQ